MVQSSYLCVILHVKNKKLPFILILTSFLILCKSADFSQGSLLSKAFLSDV